MKGHSAANHGHMLAVSRNPPRLKPAIARNPNQPGRQTPGAPQGFHLPASPPCDLAGTWQAPHAPDGAGLHLACQELVFTAGEDGETAMESLAGNASAGASSSSHSSCSTSCRAASGTWAFGAFLGKPGTRCGCLTMALLLSNPERSNPRQVRHCQPARSSPDPATRGHSLLKSCRLERAGVHRNHARLNAIVTRSEESSNALSACGFRVGQVDHPSRAECLCSPPWPRTPPFPPGIEW